VDVPVPGAATVPVPPEVLPVFPDRVCPGRPLTGVTGWPGWTGCVELPGPGAPAEPEGPEGEAGVRGAVGTASRCEWLATALRDGTKVTSGAWPMAGPGAAGSEAARSARSSICLVTEGVTDSGSSIAVCRFVDQTLT